MWHRIYRRRRRWLAAAAALPLLQTASCDPTAFFIQFGSNFASSVIQQVLVAGYSAMVSFLLQALPGSNILQALLGGNAGLFP